MRAFFLPDSIGSLSLTNLNIRYNVSQKNKNEVKTKKILKIPSKYCLMGNVKK